jgi:hypothetical protein
MKILTTACFLLLAAGALTSCRKAITPSPVGIDSLRIGLLAYYPFNNSGADSSGKGNHISYYVNITSVQNRFNKPNSAFSFDGLASYLTIPDINDLRLNNTDFTLNAWVKPVAFNNSNGSFIFCKRTSGLNAGWGLSITGFNSGLGIVGGIFFGAGGTNPYALSTKSITLNNWHMVTVIYTLSKQQLSFYIDGVLDNTVSNIPAPDASIAANLYIGRDNPANFGTGYFYKGSYDDMRIYKRALTSNDVKKLPVSLN